MKPSIHMNPSIKKAVERIRAPGTDLWKFSNDVLYTLCKDKPLHKENDVIIAKVWLIGRSYAVALERRKIPAGRERNPAEAFYEKEVAPAFLNSKLDEALGSLDDLECVDDQSLHRVLEVHNHLVHVVCSVTKMRNRSFASKYLHFHRPNLFFLYDTRAAEAVSKHFVGRRIEVPQNVDHVYARFCQLMLRLRSEVEDECGQPPLTPRQLDRLLLGY